MGRHADLERQNNLLRIDTLHGHSAVLIIQSTYERAFFNMIDITAPTQSQSSIQGKPEVFRKHKEFKSFKSSSLTVTSAFIRHCHKMSHYPRIVEYETNKEVTAVARKNFVLLNLSARVFKYTQSLERAVEQNLLAK
eukprot:Blabericola_migrator_1__12814@NODE_826_length_6365_cov_81_999047_g583_i0_p3_GENE_NODE_826_length_6365_cov_81_999047_g583_i0NODE_826_length_6365_cov_81_999047_g583_i0_p3_ORF_typecomplete_len137_score15_84MYT1/PF08474_11/0_099_NODE_826_length_6365_cov_81_999047_g583_i055495959